MTAVRLDPADAIRLGRDLLEAHGATADHADLVARHLIDSDRMGLGSHGMLRLIQYVREMDAGTLAGGASPSWERSSPTQITIDGNWGFGQVAGALAVRLAGDAAAAEGMGMATVRRVGHTGRIGAFTAELARAGFVALAFGASAPIHHRVAPFGGRDGRMSTNPISWAVQSETEILCADLATSSMPEGRIRRLQAEGGELPPDVLLDAAGRPSTDPADLYTQPPGVLLPLGGLHHGHKGSAIALIGELLATLLAGDVPDDATGRGNNLAVIAIRADGGIASRASRLADYVRSARPLDPSRPVLLPGELERRAFEASTSIAIDPSTWSGVHRLAVDAGIVPPEPLS